MWRRVHIVWTDVSEERIASIFRLEKSAKEEPAWAGGCSRSSETSVYTVSTRGHIPEDCHLVRCSSDWTHLRVHRQCGPCVVLGYKHGGCAVYWLDFTPIRLLTDTSIKVLNDVIKPVTAIFLGVSIAQSVVTGLRVVIPQGPLSPQCLSGHAVGPTPPPPIQGVIKLTIHLYLVLRRRMHGTMPPPPICRHSFVLNEAHG
jgi:hypothetical protein